MWWAVPEGQTSFATWQEVTTVYHEGVTFDVTLGSIDRTKLLKAPRLH